MNEPTLSDLIAAIKDNTAALREVLAAGIPTNVVPITTETPKPAAAPKGKAKAAPEPEAPAETERPTKVAVETPAAEEFSDPLDPSTKVVVKGDPAPEKIDVDAVIKDCVESFKAHMTAASDDPERKAFLKDQFPLLREKYGMKPDDKLVVLSPTPEKLVGLLADIKAL